LYVDPNAVENRVPEMQRSRLTHVMDWIRIGMAGNLRDYSFISKFGRSATGKDIDYNGSPAGYTLSPQENIVYVSAHDNETLFDAIQLKAPVGTSMEDRVRMQNLGNSLVMFSQGIPFFHAGDDMLRSKSMDRDSYNSGDWFNRLDFTYETNNWGAGLPPAHNSGNWPIMAPLLADPSLKPGREHILSAVTHFQEILQIRRSSPLLRLRTAEEVQSRLAFYNTGPEQVPGLLVYSISDEGGSDLDARYELMVVMINASPEPRTYTIEEYKGLPFQLHPIQAASADMVVRQSLYESESAAFTVPGRTAAVFVSRRGLAPAIDPGVYLPWIIMGGLALLLVAAVLIQLGNREQE
jgi:pullulanase